MFDIKIMIAGMILLTSHGRFDGTLQCDEPYESAAAVSAPVQSTGSFDVDIPAHQTTLRFNNIQTVPPIPGGQLMLNGVQVYFGTTDNNGHCLPVPSGAVLGPTAANLPRLSTILKNDPKYRKLADSAHPASGDFSGMKNGPVSAWLEIPKGVLMADHQSKVSEAVEFRPSQRVALLTSEIFELYSGSVTCMMVTPFDSNVAPTPYQISSPSFNVTFENKVAPEAEMTSATPGIGYDFELLYRLLDNHEGVPPLPYSLAPVSAPPTPDKVHQAGGEINTSTGVNCGPGGH